MSTQNGNQTQTKFDQPNSFQPNSFQPIRREHSRPPLCPAIRTSKLSLLACLTAFTIGLTGCGKTKPIDPAPKTKTTQSESPHDKVATTSMHQKLTGVWLGWASLDQSRLQEALSQLPPAQRAVTAAKAKSFLSTVMAIDFRRDGTVENDLEIVATNGQVLRDGTTGNWTVLESTIQGVLVETTETIADGSVSRAQKRYQFLSSENEFAMPVEVDAELSQFNARMVFQRQSLPPTNVAKGSTNSQTK